MKLLDLTPAEIAFLSQQQVEPDTLPQRLTRRLGTMLSARLRTAVQVHAHAGTASRAAPAAPCWQPDGALATLWLTRRLGGQHATGVATFVPRSLIRSLDAMLAECWLDAAAPAAMPPAQTWRIEADSTEALLVLQWPHHTNDMTRWARETIGHD